MKILYAAPEKAWGGFLELIRVEHPQHHFEVSGRFGVDSLKGDDVLIPTMYPVTEAMLAGRDGLRLVQQCGSGLEGVDLAAARRRNIAVANVPTDKCGNADSVAGLDVFWEEPPNLDDPIFRHNALATSHIAGSTDVAMQGIVKVVAENIRRVEKNLKPLYYK